jgi:prophage regulatory protein
MAVQIYRRAKVKEVTGWSTSTLYDKIATGAFPKPVKLDPNGRAVGWLETEVAEWQAQRIAERDGVAAATKDADTPTTTKCALNAASATGAV